MSRGLIRSAAAAVAVMLMVAPGRADAAPGGGGDTGTDGDQVDGVVSVGVTYGEPGSDGGPSRCTWILRDGTGITIGGVGTVVWPREENGVIYHLYERTCDGVTRWVQVPDTTPTDILPLLLEELKQRRLPKPEPVLQLLDPDFGWAYVRTPLDFRAGGGTWRTVSVTASVGPVWATATAVPLSLTFDSGDPNGATAAVCEGDAATAEYDPAVPGACSYTYLNASSTSPSDGYHFDASMSIGWDISWTSSTGEGGPLDGYSTTATVPLAVAEVKGLVTCTGSRPEQGGC